MYVSRAFAALFLLIAVLCEGKNGRGSLYLSPLPDIFFASLGLTIAVWVRRPSRLKPENDNSQTTSDSQFAIKSLLDAGFTIRALSFGIYASVGIVFAVVSLLSNSPAP
ncbi:hypothetical protein BDY24DRAFT_383339 [Mrakia frigida]|uniref:uncharacterized protein n=1 Tax=Mrakia frigida TaxID=29902 RepID=UPI003FCC0C1E